ncbi:unnamed protein product [Candidula unifasciata]|uniref:BHLH domain-containing protein n=1 Tax=Candidula unifasciata TaxID=100452 RepID=A0A8S3ZP98_9EUPU|nr:unnamed protein product [Candidula unifasciata]
MFSSTTEVDCCLEEFARVLVANGYIGEDSCFNDADIPSLLNAFESSSVLDSPDSFSVSPCGYGDLSRALDMAQMTSQSLLDSCLSDNLAHMKPSAGELHPVSSQISYIDHPVVSDSRPMVSDSRPMVSDSRPTSFKDNICSNNVFVNNVHGHINMYSDSLNKEHKATIPVCNTEGSRSLLPPSLETHLETSSCQLDLLCQNIPVYDVFPPTHEPQQSSLYLQNTTVSPGNASPEVLSSRPKQKRKRRSKGYAKTTKAKKRKTRELTETKVPSKPKKRKLPTQSVQEQHSIPPDRSSQDASDDVPQEDSGFESADGKMGSTSGSTVDGALGGALSSENPESVDNSGANQSLRRSSRTSRNPENYNFRTSSLVKRVETERRQQQPRQPKDKSKPVPLSKYRRRTANARERDRMKEINDAFDTLRSSLPTIQRDDGKNKITKFTILKHALNYIIFPSMHDDETSSDLSSIRPGSVASFSAEDSCSSPTSGHSTTSNPISSKLFFSQILHLHTDKVQT